MKWTRPTNTTLLVSLGALVLTIGCVAMVIHSRADNSSKESPSFATVLPQGASIESLGGWRKASPPGSDPAFAYTDTVDSVAVSVSQQKLPRDFSQNPAAHVAELAKSYNATTQFIVDDTPIYIGTSAKGPQSVIFTKRGLLILIKSQQKISDVAWKRYITSLE